MLTRTDVELGPLLAEGGEGRVYELRRRPGMLFKEYRSPAPLEWAEALVNWPAEVAAASPGHAARIRSATAWPQGVVAADTGAAGLLLPRAPAGFWLRHRDGAARLATLSYLTADPDRRAAAYGLTLPPPMAPKRLALAYALARLLVAFHEGPPPVNHGDLSARNVLWSLDGAPRVYLIDCDNSEIDGQAGPPRRRAMTPNWDDPSVPAGTNPDALSDRYSLALIFLRVAGAAHYPLQARQRRRETVAIDFDLPSAARHLPTLRRGAPLWRLCAAGLSMRRSSRPGPAEWAEVLEAVLADLGSDLAAAVRQAQDGPAGTPSSLPGGDDPADIAAGRAPAVPASVRAPAVPASGRAPAVPASGRAAVAPAPPLPSDVLIRPVAATARTQAWRVVTTRPADAEEVEEPVNVNTQVRRQLRYAARWWWIAHRRMVRLLMSRRSHLRGVRRLAFLAMVDFALACAAVFLFAMIVSPFLGL